MRGLRALLPPRGCIWAAAALLWLPQAALGACPQVVPKRIVSLAPSITEVLFAIGAGERVVGVSSHSDFPTQARALPRVGSFLVPNVESVVSRRPDLVIAVPSPGNRDAVRAIERMGIPVLVVGVDSLAETERAIVRIGECVGAPSRAHEVVARIRREIESVEGRLAGAPTRRVLVVVGREPLVAAGPLTFVGELVKLAHGQNVAPPGSRWPTLGLEWVIAADPDVVIDTSMGSEAASDGAPPAEVWAPLASLRAARQGRIVSRSLDRLLRPGPRLARGVRELAQLIHPERF